MEQNISIKDTLKDVLSDIWEKKKRQQAIGLWSQISGERVSKHTTPIRLAKGILTVEVENPGWLYEIQNRHRQDILKKAKEILGEDKIKDIRYRVGAK
jgi:predicted nucleic acid-binding Zn ribbon protein